MNRTRDPADFCKGPSTRYQGSKRKILPWIWEHLSDLSFTSVLDAFGGSASVSYLFKRMGKEVTYNDYMRWNYIIGQALIENDSTRLSPDEIEFLTSPVTTSDSGLVSSIFRGVYFTKQENLWIDAMVRRIAELPGGGNKARQKRAVAYYALFQTCLVKRPFNMFHRANLSIRLAEIERSFGNKTTWDRRFSLHFRAFVDELHDFIIEGKHFCRATNFCASELPPEAYDMVYLDPPYLKREGSNETADYWRCYHFLEGLARYEEWPALIDYTSKLRKIPNLKDEPWLDSSRSARAFEQLIAKFEVSTFAVSYKKFGSPSIDTLVRIFKRFGKRVTTHSKHYKYALNQQNGSAELNRECLIIAE